MRWEDKYVTIGDIGKMYSGGTPSKKNQEFWNGPIPWVSAKDLKKSRIAETGSTISALGAEKGSRVIPADTILFVVRGMSLAKEFRVGLTTHPMAFNQDLKAVVLKEGVVPKFALYYLLGNEHEILGLCDEAAHGTKRLQTDLIKSFPFWLPPLPTQRKIAGILSAYDDLIENNLRRIQLLEEAAQNIYREWFVHFRFPGHEKVKMGVDGLPEGWRREKIGSFCITKGGGTPSTKKPEFWDNGKILWFSPSDLSKSSSLVLTKSNKTITGLGLEKSSARRLPPRTILMSSRATIGLFGIINQPCSTNQGFINIIPKEEMDRYFLLFELIIRKKEIISKASGSTFKEISKGVFRDMDLVVPTSRLRKMYWDQAQGLLETAENLLFQNQSLKAARDILLPRLMNQSIPV